MIRPKVSSLDCFPLTEFPLLDPDFPSTYNVDEDSDEDNESVYADSEFDQVDNLPTYL